MFRYAAALVFAGVLAAQELPYIVEFPLSPASPGRAATTLDDRISAAVRFEACGNELEFFDLASSSDAGESINAMIIAKMLWASGGLGPNSPRIFPFVCTSHIRRGLGSFSPADADDLSHNRLAAFNARLSALWSCPNIITN